MITKERYRLLRVLGYKKYFHVQTKNIIYARQIVEAFTFQEYKGKAHDYICFNNHGFGYVLDKDSFEGNHMIFCLAKLSSKPINVLIIDFEQWLKISFKNMNLN